MKVHPLLLSLALPLVFCRCGGKETAEVDSIEVVKSTLFPTFTPKDDDLSAEMLAAAQKKNWGEIIETCSDKPPVWKTEPLPDHDGYTGVRADVVIMDEEGWVKFKVAENGSAVTAFQVGNGDEVDTDDEEEIALGFAGLYAMKSGDVDTSGLMANAKAQVVATKNLVILKGSMMVAHVYSADHDGAFPEDLKALSSIEEAGPFRRPTDPATGEEVDPIYFEGLDSESPGHLMLLACPFTNPDGKRTVAYVNGAAENIPEAEYQERKAKQQGE